MSYVAIINGPNLNLLGLREPEIYGNKDFLSYLEELRKDFEGTDIQYLQSNVEGELINAIQEHGFAKDCAGIVLNAGGYTHTSIAIADAIASIKRTVLAVHISNIFAREEERRTDLLVAKCKGMICGLGLKGYKLAIEWLLTEAQ